MLLCLASYSGQILSQEQLYEQVWKEEPAVGVNGTVRVHIGKLKKKLSTVSDFNYIHNVWGVGYKFVPPKMNQRQVENHVKSWGIILLLFYYFFAKFCFLFSILLLIAAPP